MPGIHPKRAKSKAQLEKAYANSGQNWAQELIQGTESTKGLPSRVKAPKKHGKGKK